jgi:hypothetical protein
MHVAVARGDYRAPGKLIGLHRQGSKSEPGDSSGENDAGHCQPLLSMLVITPDNSLHSWRIAGFVGRVLVAGLTGAGILY